MYMNPRGALLHIGQGRPGASTGRGKDGDECDMRDPRKGDRKMSRRSQVEGLKARAVFAFGLLCAFLVVPSNAEQQNVVERYPPREDESMRDDHTRVWYLPCDVEITHPITGHKVIEHTITRYHEKGCGLCYVDSSGRYVPASPEWQRSPSGFALAKAAYSAEASEAEGG